MPMASNPDSAQCDPVSRPIDSVQWATDKPSTPTPTAPTVQANRRACTIALRDPRGLLATFGLRVRCLATPLTDSAREITLNSDMGLLLNQGSCVESWPRV